jgi:O-antigen ligase
MLRAVFSRLSIPLVEILVFLLFAYISLVPFYYLQPLQLTATLPPFFLPKYLPFLLALLLALAWLYEALKAKKQIRKTGVGPFVAAYLGISLLSLVNAPYPLIGFAKWGYYHVTGVLLSFLVIQYFAGWSAVRRLAMGLCIVGGIVVTYTLITFLLGKDLLWEDFQRQFNPKYTPSRVTGPFGNPTSTGTYFMLLFPFSFWLAYEAASLVKKAIYLCLSVFFLLAIVLTQTRGALLAALVATAILVSQSWWLASTLQKWHRRLLLLLLLLLVLGIAASLIRSDLAASDQFSSAKARWEALFSPGALAYTERYRISQYKTTLNVLTEHPFLGTGFGNFTRSFAIYRDTSNYIVAEFPEHTTDNMYLMVAAETGWLGLVVTAILLGAILSTVYRAYRRASTEPPAMLLLAFLAGGIGFLINLATWDALNDPTIRMTFWLLAGIALSVVHLKHRVNSDGTP